MAEADIRSERLKKLALLKETGMEAYPVRAEPTATIREFLADFDARAEKGGTETLVGRVMSLRGQGGIVFADIFDGSTSLAARGTSPTAGGASRVQLVLQKADMGAKQFELFANAVDAGDFVEASGVAFKTKRGERSLKVATWKMLAKSLLPIPGEWYGLKDEEKRFRERYLDILVNPDVKAMFERKATFWRSIREFYLSRGFLEVETPALETLPGGADARPFATHHHALDIDVYLRISVGELWQKRLLVAGYPKVFEIGRIFRNEGQSREHLQDYTQLESYEAYRDAAYGMTFVQELYRHIAKETYGKYTFEIGEHTVDLADRWPVIDFSDALKKKFGIDPLVCAEDEAIEAAKKAGVEFGDTPNKARAVDHLWKLVRKSIAGPAFLVGVPVYLEPLAKRSPDNLNVVDRFQILIAGSEVGKGYSELNDPEDQRARFEEQQKLRDAGDEEAQRLDEEFIRALEYGMPPALGLGVSERLFAFFENKPVHEAQLFPLLRPKGA
jgi:lysyl-tRNA synthetase class 2